MRQLYHDDRTLLHEAGVGHPERPARVETIIRRARAGEYGDDLVFVTPEPATRAQIERVHDPAHVERVEASHGRARTVFDADTATNEHSWQAALCAAGGAAAAVRAVIADPGVRPFVAMRPPGHHAEHDRAMGFCFFNNAAVAAAEALESGLERVAIIDWDVHHGNGTQEIFYRRPDVFYVSLHQAPHYPGTGRSTEIGAGDGAGFTLNVPLPAGSGEGEYLAAMDRLVLPVLEQYAPELVIVSAGFDAHERDPLAGMLLEADSYAALTVRLRSLAERTAGGRIVHILEGGYDLTALGEGVGAVLSALVDERDESGEAAYSQPRAGEERGFAAGTAARIADSAIEETATALGSHWSVRIDA